MATRTFARALALVSLTHALAACGDDREDRDVMRDESPGTAQDASTGPSSDPAPVARDDAGASEPPSSRDGGPREEPRPDPPSERDAGGPAREDAASPAPSADDAASPANPPTDSPGTWTMGTAMPTKRTELAVAELDGKIYVAGGYGGFSSFEVYDPATDRWERLADMPVEREHPCLAGADGRVFLTCGSASRGEYSPETFAYDPKSNTWSERAPMLYARWGAQAVTLDGSIYVVGGAGDNAPVLQRYDPKSDKWEARGSLSMLRDHVAATVLDGKIYALGGRPGRGAIYASIEIYDPKSDKFTPGPDMLEGRSGCGAVAIAGKIYVAGGEVLVQPFSVRDTVEMFDPATGKWSFRAKLPSPLHGTGAAAVGGRMYLMGGAGMPANSVPRVGGVNIFTP